MNTWECLPASELVPDPIPDSYLPSITSHPDSSLDISALPSNTSHTGHVWSISSFFSQQFTDPELRHPRERGKGGEEERKKGRRETGW